MISNNNNYLRWCSHFPLKEKEKICVILIMKNIKNQNIFQKRKESKIKTSYWISCSADSLCRVDALAPAAPTSHSSQSNWRSSWQESLSAGARRGFLSPLHCPDQTARPWSSSVSPDWPAGDTKLPSPTLSAVPESLVSPQKSLLSWYECLVSYMSKTKQMMYLNHTFSGLQVQERRCWSVLMLLFEYRLTHTA